MSKTTFTVTSTSDVVLVSVADPDRSRRITAALREEWPVRTARDEREQSASLDRDVSVLVVGGVETDTLDAALRHRDEQGLHFEVAGLVAADAAADDRLDARLETPVAAPDLRETVERLHRRARYDRLLDRYYGLAEHYADLSDGGDAADRVRVQSRLADLRERIDRLACDLDDADAFDVALGHPTDDDEA
ncbi:DNA-binding response regulator [Halomicrobium urmianum]|uniref:DNA-binding response regulator n=1 Tax=Halomicrobium urmianum TaxID=1586233 RepID=UPI001CD918E7|nr:DNA-binding response regulator [Halomicrobium urmianum]